jgi:hypothetical protein
VVGPGRVQLAAAVGALSVVVGLVPGQDCPQVSFSEDQHLWVPKTPSPHATCEYSRTRPPSRSRLRKLVLPWAGAAWVLPPGGFWLRVRCGRWVL